ncbi:ExbD/TolR family protein [Parvibium lacunae]|uniref:Biopolymer transporter ExbD n=1 Tax=Parvibium lacunae TaxID=1888893 RepID=A0A368L4A8_9BURK|nr:biopolymer transporter ExbD [Parvibium lacunae]RCS58355.1 biopolymer transporter ExbD [Parvibium lacunae]
MAFGGFESNAGGQPMSEINTTPLVDVMLVLLVIFIITAPLFTHAVKLDLPDAKAAPAAEQPETIRLSIDANGLYYWNNDSLSLTDIAERLQQASRRQPQPEIHLRADQAVRYEKVAQLMAAAQQAGMSKIGFVTEQKTAK